MRVGEGREPDLEITFLAKMDSPSFRPTLWNTGTPESCVQKEKMWENKLDACYVLGIGLAVLHILLILIMSYMKPFNAFYT